MPVDFQEEVQEKQGIDFAEELELQGPPEAPLLPMDISAPQMPVPVIDFTKTSGRPPPVEQSPFVSPFHFTQLVPPTGPEESSAMGITKGLTRTALSVPEFALSPAGVLSAEIGTVAPRFVTGAFSVDMLGNTLKEIPEVYAQWQKMSPGQKWDAGISIALGTLMGLGLAAKTVKGFQKQPLGMSDEAHRQAVESTTSYAEDNPGFVQYLRRLVQQRRPVPEREPGTILPPTVIQPPSEEQRQPVPEGTPSVPTAGVAAVTAAGEAPAAASESMRQRVEAVRQAGKTAPAAAAEAAKTIADEAVKAGREKVEAAPAEPAAPKEGTTVPSQGWWTPQIKGKERIAEYQSSGLPLGKFYALDRPFESEAHDIETARRVDLPQVRKVYDPDGLLGPKTENLHEAFVVEENKVPVPKKGYGFKELREIRQRFTDLLVSKGYDSYVRGIDGNPNNRELIIFEKPAAPAAELEMAVTKPDFIADNSEPFGSDRWRMKNGVGPDDKLIQIEDGGWVSESPPTNVKGQWAKFVRTVNAKGEGKVIPVNVEAPKKGVIYAPEEGKVETGVQPERVGTDAQRVSAATGPRDSVQPETPVGQEAAAPPGQAPREVLLKPKEPWEMTQKEYVDKDISIRTSTRKPSDDFLERLREQARLDHQTAVQIAIQKGKPVPAEVLADYPDLKATPSAAGPRGEVREEPESASTASPVASTAGGVAPPPAAVGQPTVTPTVAKGQAPASATMPEGPGAMTRGQRPYSAAQQLIDQLKAQPPAGVREKLSTSEKIADAWAQGKSAWNRAMARGQAITQTLKETARGVRSPTDVDRHVASLDWALQQSAGQSRIMGKQMERQWRNITDREAAAIWIDAGGDEALIQNVLANLPTGTRPNVRRAVARAANLPTNIKADLVNELRQFYSLREQDAVTHELFEQGLNDYFTHIWQKPENMPDELRAAITNGRVQTWWQFKQQREIPTFLNGIMQGKTPVLDPAKVLPFYNYSLDRAIASREFIKGLNDLTAPDGRPVVAPWGTSKQVPQGQTPQALIIKPTAKAQRKLSSAERQVLQQTGLSLDQAIEQGLITPVATADYRTIDHPAMRKWKWAGTSKAGAPILFESELAVHPDYYERLARFMDRGRLSPGPAVRSLLRASTEVKGMKLGLLSAFHQIHVGSHALWHLTNPFKSKWLGTAGEIDWESPSVQFAVEKGHLKLAPNPNELGVFAEGILGPGLIHKIPGIGPVSRAYSEWLFGDFIPRLKLATFENAYQRNMKWYEGSIRKGKITPEEVAARVGDSVNNAYGELNQLFLGKYGRSPGLQRILRGVFLAPDFGEARLRFVEKAFTKYGNEERMALALMFTTMYTAARVSNWYSHGDPEWDSKNAFRVKVGDHWWTMRSVVGDLAHAFSNLSQFMYVRLNPLYSRTVMDWLYSRDYQGRKLSAFDKVVKRPLEQLIPIQLGSLTRDDQKLWESFITAMGVSASHERPVAEVNEAVRKWMLSSGDPLLQAMGKKREQELFAPSAYAPLRRALLEQNWKKAKTEYIALRNLHDHKIIDRTLNPRTAAGEKPLGALGRKQWLAFLQSVKGGTSEAKSVAAALEERDLIYARFKQLMAGQQ